jgi:hypothetical protein
LADLLHAAVPRKGRSNHHRCCCWLMAGECICQLFVRHVKSKVGPRRSVSLGSSRPEDDEEPT